MHLVVQSAYHIELWQPKCILAIMPMPIILWMTNLHHRDFCSCLAWQEPWSQLLRVKGGDLGLCLVVWVAMWAIVRLAVWLRWRQREKFFFFKKKWKSYYNYEFLPLPMLRALKHSNPNPFFKQIDQHYIYKSINLKRKKNSPYIQFCITNKKKIAKYYRVQFQFGPFRSCSVHAVLFVPFDPFWSSSVHFSLVQSFRSIPDRKV